MVVMVDAQVELIELVFGELLVGKPGDPIRAIPCVRGLSVRDGRPAAM
jgi:hypothetical protein